jgi:hypothetical protein
MLAYLRGMFPRTSTAVSNCHDPFNIPSLKPIFARVRLQRLTTFYPLARGQPHPACALRWDSTRSMPHLKHRLRR